MRSILRRLSPRHSTAVAYLALFAALGGSAYATVTVTGKDIENGTITGKDVKKGTLGTKKLNKKAVNSLTGERGPTGPQGPAGPSGISGWQPLLSDPVSLSPGYAGTASAFCPAGKKALGGGGGSDAAAELFASTPTINADGWEVTYLNNRPFTVTIRARVVCAHVS